MARSSPVDSDNGDAGVRRDSAAAMTIQPPDGIIEAEFEEKARPHRETLNGYVELREWELATDEDLQLATHGINEIRHIDKELEEAEKSLTAPILLGVNRIRALCRPDRDLARKARALMDDKIRAYLTARALRVAAAERQLEAAVKAQDHKAAVKALAITAPAPKVQGLITQEAWDYEEFNHSIVPTELTQTVPSLVLAEIDRQVREGCQYPAIGGCKVFKKTIVKGTGR